MKRVKPHGVSIVSDKAFTYSNINTFFGYIVTRRRRMSHFTQQQVLLK